MFASIYDAEPIKFDIDKFLLVSNRIVTIKRILEKISNESKGISKN